MPLRRGVARGAEGAWEVTSEAVDLEALACIAHRELLRDVRRDGRARTCPRCGAEYRYALAEAHSPPAPAAPRAPSGVTAFVEGVLRWHLARVRAEGTTESGAYLVVRGESSTAAACRAIETGIVGTGNRGTKGAGMSGRREPREVDATPEDAADRQRYVVIDTASREVVDAIIADAQGDRSAPVTLGTRTYELTLAQRLALPLAGEKQRARWVAKLCGGDSAPALDGMRDAGTKRLRDAASAWWAA